MINNNTMYIYNTQYNIIDYHIYMYVFFKKYISQIIFRSDAVYKLI